MDQISDSAESLPSRDARLRYYRGTYSTCFVPSAGDLDETASPDRLSLRPYELVRARRSGDLGSHCTNNRCLCCCHQQVLWPWGCLRLSHTQTSSIRTPCNRTSCKVRSLKTMVAADLSWMKIRLAVIASLEIFWGLGSLSIKPSLDVKRIVAPDSRGFSISNKFRTGEYSAVEAVKEFRGAFQRGEASLMDVTPDGRSLTESIMEIDSLEIAQESCWDIAYILKTVACHSVIMECLPALFKFCETAFEFGRIDPFDIVNELGIVYDVADEDVLAFHHIIYEGDDPFGIKWLQRCLKKCPGFANIPPLIQKVLLDDHRTLTRKKIASARSINETFLGRSALHWATCNESWVRGLLEAGHAVSPVDRRGRSPLIYAAAYGLLGSFSALLEAGADPTSGHQRQNGCEWDVVPYAMCHGHFHIVFRSIAFYRRDSIGGSDIAQTLLDEALRTSCSYLRYAGSRVQYYLCRHSEKGATVHKLLMLGANPDLFKDDGTNLLHQSWASDTEVASLLLGAGTKHLDVGDARGETPAMCAAYGANVPLLQLYLHKGARLQRRDNHGRNIVHYAIREFQQDLSWFYPDDRWCRYSTLKTVLSYNVDPNVGDHCRCACSLNGCSPSTMLMKQLFSGYEFGFRPAGLVLSIEWLLLLQELVSYNAADKAFTEFVRFLLFNLSGLTHVCCRPKLHHRSLWQQSPIDQEDISEILDEEQELIAALEEDLETLRSPLDQRDPAETWADILVDFAIEHEDLARSSDPAKTSFRHALLHYKSETGELLRAVHTDDAVYYLRLEQRLALIRRCLNRLDAKQGSKAVLRDRRDWDTAIQGIRVHP